MNQEDITRMAREAGFNVDVDGAINDGVETAADFSPELSQFAFLVAAAERERNAQIADAHASVEGIAQLIAAEIRGQA